MTTRDEIKEEVERQLRERDAATRNSRWHQRSAISLAIILALFGGRLSWAQQHMNGPGGSHYMADLFKVFFTWDASNLTIAGNRGIISQAASGSNGFAVSTNGARIDFGAGANDYASSDGTTVTFAPPIAGASTISAGTSVAAGSSVSFNTFLNFASTSIMTMGQLGLSDVDILGSTPNTAGNTAVVVVNTTTLTASDDRFVMTWYRDSFANRVATLAASGYFASNTPHTMFVTYINNTIGTFTYGGGVAPAHDFEVSAVRFAIRTAGSGGTTNANIRISDGVSNCDCSFACNTAAGNQRIACGTDANCDFEASDSMTVSVSAVGDCAVTTDILGNIEFETLWE